LQKERFDIEGDGHVITSTEQDSRRSRDGIRGHDLSHGCRTNRLEA
jgi:hypothetical protein